MRLHRVLVSCLILAACGDDGGHSSTPDVLDQLDVAPDSPIVVGMCDYTEQHDTTNDDISGTVAGGAAEATGEVFTSGSVTICGQIDSTHFVAPELVDADSYLFTV